MSTSWLQQRLHETIDDDADDSMAMIRPNVRAGAASGFVPRHRHPMLRAWLAHDDRCELPDIDALETARIAATADDGIQRPTIRAQTNELLADGLHYETRIAERGVLATRENDAHDAFNALVWLRHPQLKHALNARQVADIARVGTKQRTRGQCALTHFDEAGAIAWVTDTALLTAWDAHDWPALFVDQRVAWGTRIAVTVFGHALIEHVWNGHELPVAKTLVVAVDARQTARQAVAAGAVMQRWPMLETNLAAAIRDGRLLADPQELRPLPLAGIPGWHVLSASADFIASAPCFRPLRPGRCYPLPLVAPSASA